MLAAVAANETIPPRGAAALAVSLDDSWANLCETQRLADPLHEKLAALIESFRCGDSSCWFGHGGMCTNGGCCHGKMDKHELRRDFQTLVRDVRELLDGD